MIVEIAAGIKITHEEFIFHGDGRKAAFTLAGEFTDKLLAF
jgi:hypothetical protein